MNRLALTKRRVRQLPVREGGMAVPEQVAEPIGTAGLLGVLQKVLRPHLTQLLERYVASAHSERVHAADAHWISVGLDCGDTLRARTLRVSLTEFQSCGASTPREFSWGEYSAI